MANISSINGNPIVVGTSGIEQGAVHAEKIVNGGVTTEKLAAGAVTAAKLADGAAGDQKLDPNGVRNAITALGVLYDNEAAVSPEFELGYYSSSATWISNATYAENKTLLSYPSGVDLYAETTISGVYPLIAEFRYEDGSLVRKRVVSAPNGGVQKVVMEDTQDGCTYAFGLRKASGTWSDVPSTGFSFYLRSKLLGDMENGLDSLYGIMTEGRSEIAATLEHGYYYSDGTWRDSSTHLSPHELYQPPFAAVLTAETTIEGVTPYIKEYTYDGEAYTRTRNLSGNPAVLEDADPDKYYSFDLFGDEISTIPTTGYEFSVQSQYLYDLKHAGDSKTMTYEYSANSKVLVLTGRKTRYTIQRVTDATKNLDSWRLYRGEIRIDGTWEDLWYRTDAEGPVRLVGQSDFISGYHGDEMLQSVAFYIDNLPLDLAANASGECSTLALYQESTCYNDTLSIPAFTRYKKLEFRDGGDFAVQQRWVALQECTVMRGAMALIQCYKSNATGWDTDRLLPLQPTSTGGSGEESVYLDAETTTGTIYLRDGTSLSIVAEQGQEAEGYTPRMTYFNSQNRVKFYFDMHNGQELGVGDELISRFAVRVDRGV